MGLLQCARKIVQKHLSFKNLLILSNATATFSGYFCIYIDPATFTRKKSFTVYFYYILSFAFSIIANAYNAYVPIATITRSDILEFLYNFLNRCSVNFSCGFKVLNFFTYKRFYKTFEDLQWCNIKVIDTSFDFTNNFMEILISTHF